MTSNKSDDGQARPFNPITCIAMNVGYILVIMVFLAAFGRLGVGRLLLAGSQAV